jgi:DNA (cytosine-5)-methyltransferase 1
VFVVGSRDGVEFQFPRPTHAAAKALSQGGWLQAGVPVLNEPVLTAWDAIGDLQDDDDPALQVTGKWGSLLPSIPEGANYLYHTARGEGLELFGWRRRYWSFLLKLSKALPSWTIAAQPGPAIGPFHWKNRRLSARELCRLQTIPDDYHVVGGLRAVQRQLGNAVPSALAEKLALEIREQLLGNIGASTQSPSLIPKRRGSPPPPEPVLPVPRDYHSLVGAHDPHPGTGKGYGAIRRMSASVEDESA